MCDKGASNNLFFIFRTANLHFYSVHCCLCHIEVTSLQICVFVGVKQNSLCLLDTQTQAEHACCPTSTGMSDSCQTAHLPPSPLFLSLTHTCTVSHDLKQKPTTRICPCMSTYADAHMPNTHILA